MELPELEANRNMVSTKSGEISYIDIGAGPAAVFVHGVGSNAYLWRHVIGAVADVRRCVALDLPLHGKSPVAPEQDLSIAALATVLEDFCDALGLERIDLVANDTGGAVAQVFAARHPERLTTLTLTNCDTADNLPPEEFKPIVDLAKAGALAPAVAGMLDNINAARDTAFASAYEDPDQVDPQIIRAYMEPTIGTPERARQFERLLAALDPDDLRAVEPQLRALQVPTLIVWGTGDSMFDVSWAYWLRDTIPGVTKVVTIDGAHLFFPEERPAVLAAALTEHWWTHPASVPAS